MRHPNQELLLRFTAGMAPADQAQKIVSHLGDCGPCTERFQALRQLRHDFEGSWEAFLAEAAHRLALPARSAAAAPVVLAAFRGLVDRSQRLASAALDRLGDLLPAGGSLGASFAPAYSGVADARASAQAQVEAEAASRAIAAGDLAGALGHLRAAAAHDPQTSASAGVDLKVGTEIAGRLVVDATRGSVSVVLYPEVLPITGGTVALEREAGAPATRVPLEAQPGSGHFLAEIEDLPDGPLTVLVEIEGL